MAWIRERKIKNGRTRWKAQLPNRMELPPLCVDELVITACLRSPELTAFQVEDGRAMGSFKLDHLDAWFTTVPSGSLTIPTVLL